LLLLLLLLLLLGLRCASGVGASRESSVDETRSRVLHKRLIRIHVGKGILS